LATQAQSEEVITSLNEQVATLQAEVQQSSSAASAHL
jgi:hypothetical protein